MPCSGCSGCPCQQTDDCLPADVRSLEKWRKDFENLRKQWSDYTLSASSNSCCDEEPSSGCRCSCNAKRSDTDCNDPKTTKDKPKPSQHNEPKLAKGRFGLAWIAETPKKKCYSPCGWQLEICDTPSKIERECNKMMEWVSCPPIDIESDCNCSCNKQKPQKEDLPKKKAKKCPKYAIRVMPFEPDSSKPSACAKLPQCRCGEPPCSPKMSSCRQCCCSKKNSPCCGCEASDSPNQREPNKKQISDKAVNTSSDTTNENNENQKGDKPSKEETPPVDVNVKPQQPSNPRNPPQTTDRPQQQPINRSRRRRR